MINQDSNKIVSLNRIKYKYQNYKFGEKKYESFI
jgi:hypothetical protein